MFERYAIFYTPPEGPLADFGARWLGWDNAKGRKLAHPYADGLDVAAITATPRQYGIHGTLKAPFHLAQGLTQDDLLHGVQDFARNHAAVRIAEMDLAHHHGFVGLRPVGENPALGTLASDIVRKLDTYRAPLSEAYIARRRRAGLTPKLDAQMLEWGYPYIFDDFHFHLTLSGQLPVAQAAQVIDALSTPIARALPAALDIEAITLMGEDADGMFHQIHRATLSG